MSKIYERMYGLSFVGDLDETAQALAEILQMSFEKRHSDWLGDYCLMSNEERTEKLRLFNDSGQETHFNEDYGDYELFLEVSVESLERAREIEQKLGAAHDRLHQTYTRRQKAARYSSSYAAEPRVVRLKRII
jgi:hypothetical protein